MTERRNVILPVTALTPNAWNPNRMGSDDFDALVEEVRRLGAVAKPIIVRERSGSYEIVDGEHNWLAAQAAGLTEVRCDVEDWDDFEAMRQTYKRNRSGSDDPVALGRMLRRMRDSRGGSGRKLALEIKVSEGTVRNWILYADAVDVRNGYAPKHAEGDIARLDTQQVRLYMKKWPEAERDARLDRVVGRTERFVPPAGSPFPVLDPHQPTDHICPYCGYCWNGRSSPAGFKPSEPQLPHNGVTGKCRECAERVGARAAG